MTPCADLTVVMFSLSLLTVLLSLLPRAENTLYVGRYSECQIEEN